MTYDNELVQTQQTSRTVNVPFSLKDNVLFQIGLTIQVFGLEHEVQIFGCIRPNLERRPYKKAGATG